MGPYEQWRPRKPQPRIDCDKDAPDLEPERQGLTALETKAFLLTDIEIFGIVNFDLAMEVAAMPGVSQEEAEELRLMAEDVLRQALDWEHLIAVVDVDPAKVDPVDQAEIDRLDEATEVAVCRIQEKVREILGRKHRHTGTEMDHTQERS